MQHSQASTAQQHRVITVVWRVAEREIACRAHKAYTVGILLSLAAAAVSAQSKHSFHGAWLHEQWRVRSFYTNIVSKIGV